MEVPLLQIIHYSDMHLAVDGYVSMRWLLKRAYPRLSHESQQGWAGPRRAVLPEFIHLIEALTTNDSAWADRPAWLVDTGDGTTFGDVASLEEWQEWSDQFAQASGPQGRLMRVYGNHDGWPGTFPLLDLGLQSSMDSQRNMLRRQHFRETWPELPWTVTVPGTPTRPGAAPSQIELYAVNTVDHDLLVNAAALGVAARDRRWSLLPNLGVDTPADDVARRAWVQPGGATGRNLRIAAMHYPVANDATPGNHTFVKVLANRKRFASDLQQHPQVKPLVVHVLLAGHTHLPFPSVGQLPRSASAATHLPLVAGQCQVVSGSLSQLILPGTALHAGASWAETVAFNSPYQCTVLRFYGQPDNPEELIMDRAIVGTDDSAIFAYLKIAPGSQQVWERMTFRL